jgi:hypothetical protein
LKAHEVARVPIVAPHVDLANVTLNLLTGAVAASPVLRKLVIGKITKDTITLRRPDRRVVEIVVVAASQGGMTLRGRWFPGFGFDEVAQFGSASTGDAVNVEELLRAAETRLVPGGQGWMISSPYGPQGLLYELYKAHFGKPGRVLVIHAPTRALNPVSVSAEMVEAIRLEDPDAAAREYDAAWVDADGAFLDGASIDHAIRTARLEIPPAPSGRYVAAWDAGTRGNAWTLIIARNVEGSGITPRIEVAVAREWVGSKSTPLKPDEVIAEIGPVVRAYGVREVMSDSWSADALGAIARGHGLMVREWRGATRADRIHEMYRKVSVLLSQGRINLPPHPVLRNDLKLVRRKATANGVRIELPKTPDGRHADFAPALVLAAFFAELAPASNGAFTGGPVGAAGPSSGRTLEEHLRYGATGGEGSISFGF